METEGKYVTQNLNSSVLWTSSFGAWPAGRPASQTSGGPDPIVRSLRNTCRTVKQTPEVKVVQSFCAWSKVWDPSGMRPKCRCRFKLGKTIFEPTLTVKHHSRRQTRGEDSRDLEAVERGACWRERWRFCCGSTPWALSTAAWAVRRPDPTRRICDPPTTRSLPDWAPTPSAPPVRDRSTKNDLKYHAAIM